MYKCENNLNKNFFRQFKIGNSKIEGKGVLARRNLLKNEKIGVVFYYVLNIFPRITQNLGRWINHSYEPNTHIYYNPKTSLWYLVTNRDIKENEELTANYNDTPWFIKKAEPHYK